MTRTQVLMAMLIVLFTVACGPTSEKDGETVQPVTLKLSEAQRVTVEYLAFVTAEKVEPTVNNVERLGCNSSMNSALPFGPPWRLRMQREFAYPTPEVITDVLSRVESLSSRGFQRQEKKSPGPEAPNDRTYRDQLGYMVGVHEEVRGDGVPLYVVTVSSPCADED